MGRNELHAELQDFFQTLHVSFSSCRQEICESAVLIATGNGQMVRAYPKLDPVDFSDSLRRQNDIRSCAALFKAAITPYGFDAFACGEVDLANRGLNVFYILDWPEEWLRFYRESGFIERDPLLDAVANRRHPFVWSYAPNNKSFPNIGSEANRLFSKHGWTGGLVVPIARHNENFGLVSLVGRIDALQEKQIALIGLVSELLLARIRSLGPRNEFVLAPAQLTRREIESLQLVAQGFSDKEIAEALGVATSTAHEFVERARKRLKAQTRAQMIGRAVSLGIVNGG